MHQQTLRPPDDCTVFPKDYQFGRKLHELPGAFEGEYVHKALYGLLVAHLPPAPHPDGVHGDIYESTRELAWLMSFPIRIYVTGEFNASDWLGDPLDEPSFRNLYDLIRSLEPLPPPSSITGHDTEERSG